jgi:hypothetical protein
MNGIVRFKPKRMPLRRPGRRNHATTGGLIQEVTLFRERALKLVLLLVGLLFTAAIYPVTMILWQQNQSGYTDAMMGSIYFTLGFSC